MKYLALFDLQVKHSYYADLRCTDLSISPTPETHRLLKNYGCVFKALPDGVRVLAAANDDSTLFISMPHGIKFTFYLSVQNPDFALFTDLSAISQAVAPTYTNAGMEAGNPVQLALLSRPVEATECFAVYQPSANETFTLSGRPLAGLTLADFNLAGLGASSPADFDAAAKIITVNSQAASPGDTFTVTYPTIPHRERGVLAEIELVNNASLPGIATGPAQFEVAFDVKTILWVYYVVADQNNTPFTIQDGGDPALVFSDDQQPDPTDKIAAALAEQYPDKQRIRFISNDPVPCRKQTKRSIQLFLGSNPVLTTLPNPALQNYAIVKEKDVLFQVVKYYTH